MVDVIKCHGRAFYGIYDRFYKTQDIIKCGNMGIKRTVSIRLIDYTKEKVFTRTKLNKKCKKQKLKIFPCIFDRIPS